MAIEKVRSFFRSYGMEDRILESSESSATVELAAHAVGCEPARIAKTLSFDLAGEPILVVTAGDMRIAGANSRRSFTASPRCCRRIWWKVPSVTLSVAFAPLPSTMA